MRITIIGGHGKVALLTAALLTKAGHQVTSVVRNPDHIADVEATGAVGVVGDVEQLDTAALGELVRGSDGIIWSAGAGGGDPERTYAVDRDAAIRTIDAAQAEGVRRFVMISYVRSGRDDTPADSPFRHYADAKAAADKYLMASKLQWTILGPGSLTDDESFGEIEFGHHVTHGDTSRGNVARLAAKVVGRADLAGLVVPFRDGKIFIPEALGILSRQAGSHPFAGLREGTAHPPTG